MARRFAYPVELEPTPGGVLVVTCPDLPEFVTQGDDVADAIEQGQ